MNISAVALTLYVIHLIFLIAAVYIFAFWRTYHGTRVFIADILSLPAQVFILIFLFRMLSLSPGCIGYETLNPQAEFRAETRLLVLGCLTIVTLLRFVFVFRKVFARSQELLISRSIRETIDYLPGGLCFSSPTGQPILTNRKMNELVYTLTKHTITNASSTWDELVRFTGAGGCADGCAKMETLWGDSDLYFSLPDKSIWRIRREEIKGEVEWGVKGDVKRGVNGDVKGGVDEEVKGAAKDRTPRYIQLTASQITALYKHSKDLHANNQRLAAQFERQRNILDNIIEINRAKEILQAKMRIHDDLGRSIIMTKQHLTNRTLAENINQLAEIWSMTSRSLSVFPQFNVSDEQSPGIELRKAADMIGCGINVIGEVPSDRKTNLLLWAVVREALTNAVTHAKANRLDVSITPVSHGYCVRITDNGTVRVSDIAEGSGLHNLRVKLEREGAALYVSYEDGVVLTARLPS